MYLKLTNKSKEGVCDVLVNMDHVVEVYGNGALVTVEVRLVGRGQAAIDTLAVRSHNLDHVSAEVSKDTNARRSSSCSRDIDNFDVFEGSRHGLPPLSAKVDGG